MTPLQIVLLVLGILAFQALLLIPLLVWVQRATVRLVDALRAELAASGESVQVAPAPAVYRGATGTRHSRVRGNGAAALTDRRLIVRKLIGDRVEIPTTDITGAREEKWFAGGRAGRKNHVVVSLRDGGEVGLFVTDNPAWLAALRSVARP